MPRRLEHGGGLEGGRRKIARPLSTQEPIYVLLRSTRAKGCLSMDGREFSAEIRAIVQRQAESCRIHISQFQNEGDSLHFLIHVPSRQCYLRFIRSVSGLISRRVTGAERGRSAGASKSGAKGRLPKQKSKFWDVIPFSRISPEAKSIKQAQSQIDERLRGDLGLGEKRRPEVKKSKAG